jgi:hypothetical protein
MLPVGAPEDQYVRSGCSGGERRPIGRQTPEIVVSSVPATRRMPGLLGELSSARVLSAPFTIRSPCAWRDCARPWKTEKVLNVGWSHVDAHVDRSRSSPLLLVIESPGKCVYEVGGGDRVVRGRADPQHSDKNWLNCRGYARYQLMIVRCRAARSRGASSMVASGVGVEWKLAYTVSAVREVKLLYKNQFERVNGVDAGVEVGYRRYAGRAGTAERLGKLEIGERPLIWEVRIVW